MAWVSAKVYAILSGSEEGKDIIEQLPDLTQDECDDLVDEFFSNGGKGASSNADYLKAKEDDEFEAQLLKDMDNKEVNEEDDLPWWDKPDEDEVKQAYGDKDKDKNSKKKILEMKTNKFYSSIYDKVFEGNNDFTEKDKEFILRMFENNDNPEKFVDDIPNTDYYKRMKEKAEKIPFINPNDEKIINQASQEFLSQITKGKTGDNFKKKQIVVITGLPGAGKSSEEIRPFLENSIELDNDIAKAVPTFANSYQNGLGAGKVHKASKKAEQMVMQQLIKEGYNVVIPMIGDDEDSIVRRTQPFIDAGYEMPLLIHKTISNDESRKRVLKRGIETGRFIDDDVIKEYGNSSNETHERLKKNKGVYKKDGKEYKFRIYEEENR